MSGGSIVVVALMKAARPRSRALEVVRGESGLTS